MEQVVGKGNQALKLQHNLYKLTAFRDKTVNTGQFNYRSLFFHLELAGVKEL